MQPTWLDRMLLKTSYLATIATDCRQTYQNVSQG